MTLLALYRQEDYHLLQHILTTKVDAEHIPNTRLGSKESKSAGKVRYKCFSIRLIYHGEARNDKPEMDRPHFPAYIS